MRDLVAVSPHTGRIDLFWRDEHDALWTRTWRAPTGWSGDTDLGGTPTGPPAVVAWAADPSDPTAGADAGARLEVFAIFPDGQLHDRYWDGVAWHAWESLGGELIGAPAASTWGPARLDVLAPGRDGTTWHRWWDGTRWVDWERLPS